MTCIVAATSTTRTCIGGDSCVSHDAGSRFQCAPKIWRDGPWLLGHAGTAEYCTMLRHRVKWPALVPQDLERFLLVDLPDHIREICRRNGSEVPGAGEDSGGSAVVAIAGTLWTLDDFEAERSLDTFAVAGSGSEIAIGALHATATRTPAYRVRVALTAAAQYRTDVAPPFHFLHG